MNVYVYQQGLAYTGHILLSIHNEIIIFGWQLAYSFWSGCATGHFGEALCDERGDLGIVLGVGGAWTGGVGVGIGGSSNSTLGSGCGA